MKNKKKKFDLKKFIKDNALELIQNIGFMLVVIASMIINFVFGLYMLGAILIIMSFYLARR